MLLAKCSVQYFRCRWLYVGMYSACKTAINSKSMDTFKGLTARLLYKSFGSKWLTWVLSRDKFNPIVRPSLHSEWQRSIWTLRTLGIEFINQQLMYTFCRLIVNNPDAFRPVFTPPSESSLLLFFTTHMSDTRTFWLQVTVIASNSRYLVLFEAFKLVYIKIFNWLKWLKR
jgi:hypothetical protein